MQQVSELHLKFALCVEVWQTSSLWRLRLGEEKEEEEEEERPNRSMKI